MSALKRTDGSPVTRSRRLALRECGIAYRPRGPRRRSRRSIAPMWRKSLCLGGDTTGARWVKQHLTHVCTSVGTPSPERVEGTRAWCEKADAPEYQQARGQSARSCMVKADCLKPSCGGFPLALRARYWPLSSTLSRLLLCRGKAPVEASPYGTGNNVMDTYSTNRGFYSNLGITYVPRGIG